MKDPPTPSLIMGETTSVAVFTIETDFAIGYRY
jgi:hypothetical protein